MWYKISPKLNLVKKLPYYVQGIGQYELIPSTEGACVSAYDQFFYGTKGSGILVLNGKSHEVPGGHGFFIPAGTTYEYHAAQKVWDLRWLSVGGSGLPYLYSLVGLHAGVYGLWNLAGLEIQMNKMHSELMDNAFYGNLHASTHVDEYITIFAREAGLLNEENVTMKKNDNYSRHMTVIKEYVDAHYSGPLRLNELCEITGLTPQHLNRITHRLTGMSPMEYIIKKRIDTAKELLKTTEIPISEIAHDCGFENDNYFWKTFKEKESLTPGEYRKRYGL